MLIYTSSITPRLEYIMKIMLGDLLHLEFQLTQDLSLFTQEKGAKFSYSSEPIDGLHFTATSLLFEEDIHPQVLDKISWNNFELFFPVNNGELPFDLFALSFYLISRYEEYLPDNQYDEHKRYPIEQSVAYQYHFHRKPLLNILAVEFGKILASHFPNISISHIPYSELITYDVDIAYQYKGKSIIRFCFAMIKSLFKADFTKCHKLLLTAFGKTVPDTFDTFEKHRQKAITCHQKPIHFILTSPMGKYDRNISPKSKSFKLLVKQLSTFSHIGLHPSYHTYNHLSLLKKEKRELEGVLGEKITKSRQHFLRLKFPDSYQNLIASGIKEDYSLGWQNEVGFRASIAMPFPFFDLSTNQATSLIIHPLAIMDGALKKITTSHEEFVAIYKELKESVEACGGEFISLWHNSSGLSL